MSSLRRPSTVLAAALVIGLLADQLFYGRAPGISVPLVVGLLLAALAWVARAEDRPATPANRWVGAAAMFFAILVAVRASPLLITLNLLAVGGLLVLHATLYRAESLTRLEAWRIGGGAIIAGLEAAVLPVPAAFKELGRIGGLRAHAGGALVLVRGGLLALPVLFVFVVLLSMADRVFASYIADIFSFQFPFDLAQLIGHIILTLTIAWCVAGGILVALREHPSGALLGPRPGTLPAEGETQRLDSGPSFRFLGFGEALTVLALVDLLFGAFVMVQATYLFGGLDTLERTGYTFAEYARRGFFELFAVAVLALGLLWTATIVTRRTQLWHIRAFASACAVMVGLVLLMLVSAALRMWLYEQAYGFTLLRVLTHSWMAWLAAVLVLFLIALVRDRPRWFGLGLPAAALCYLLALNLLNPDALIVRENLARYTATGDLDTDYLTTLSPDAAPELAAAIPRLGPVGEPLREHLARLRIQLEADAADDGWPAWNLGRAQAMAQSRRLDP